MNTNQVAFLTEYLDIQDKYGLVLEVIFGDGMTFLKYSQGENNYVLIPFHSDTPMYPEEVEKKILALNGSLFELNR